MLQYGCTALHFSALLGHATICQMLLAAKADPDLKSKAGRSPLDFARDSEDSETLVLVIRVACMHVLDM